MPLNAKYVHEIDRAELGTRSPSGPIMSIYACLRRALVVVLGLGGLGRLDQAVHGLLAADGDGAVAVGDDRRVVDPEGAPTVAALQAVLVRLPLAGLRQRERLVAVRVRLKDHGGRHCGLKINWTQAVSINAELSPR